MMMRLTRDPIDDARDDLTPAEPLQVAAEDPSLVYVDVLDAPRHPTIEALNTATARLEAARAQWVAANTQRDLADVEFSAALRACDDALKARQAYCEARDA